MNGSRRTAIVCDDDPLMRAVFARLLGHAGHEVVGELDNAVDAIRVARLAHPDVVILDVSLHGMSGLYALPDLLEAAPGCRVVVRTAFDSARDQAESAGAIVVDKADLGRLPHVLAGFYGAPALQGGSALQPQPRR